VKEHKAYNIGGSVMNHILCNIENKVLMSAVSFLRVNEPVLCFDGFMSTEVFDGEQLANMSDHVHLETGYRTTWVEKPMSEGIDVSTFPEAQMKIRAFRRMSSKFTRLWFKHFQITSRRRATLCTSLTPGLECGHLTRAHLESG